MRHCQLHLTIVSIAALTLTTGRALHAAPTIYTSVTLGSKSASGNSGLSEVVSGAGLARASGSFTPIPTFRVEVKDGGPFDRGTDALIQVGGLERSHFSPTIIGVHGSIGKLTNGGLTIRYTAYNSSLTSLIAAMTLELDRNGIVSSGSQVCAPVCVPLAIVGSAFGTAGFDIPVQTGSGSLSESLYIDASTDPGSAGVPGQADVTVTLDAGVWTPAGTNVTVNAAPVSVTFDSVASAGLTTVRPSASGSPLPNRYRVGSAYYDVTTNVVFGTATVCITDPSITASSVLLHFDNTVSPPAWIDVTAPGYPQKTTICSKALTHLSPFVIAVPSDTTAPATSAAVAPSPNTAGWNHGDVTVTLSATDPDGSADVAGIDYSAKGAQPIALTSVAGNSATISITAEGTTTLTFSAKDKAGNVEQPKTLEVRIDKTSPEMVLRFDPDARDLALSARDPLSGPGAVTLVSAVPEASEERGDSGEGEHQVATLRTYQVRDAADNLLTVVIRVHQQRNELSARIVSLQYGSGAVIPSLPNQEGFGWSFDQAGSLRHLGQAVQLGDDDPQISAEAVFRALTNQTVIEIEERGSERRLVRDGLVLLQLVSNKGGLGLELPTLAHTPAKAGLTRAAPAAAEVGGCNSSSIAGALALAGLAVLLRRRRR